ncbi:unnamed protein product [Malus baccata var. baccata]
MIPTKVRKENVTIKLWDLGGEPRFGIMWERYCWCNFLYCCGVPPTLGLGHDMLVIMITCQSQEEKDLKCITDKEVCCFMKSYKNSRNINTQIHVVPPVQVSAKTLNSMSQLGHLSSYCYVGHTYICIDTREVGQYELPPTNVPLFFDATFEVTSNLAAKEKQIWFHCHDHVTTKHVMSMADNNEVQPNRGVHVKNQKRKRSTFSEVANESASNCHG